MKSKVMQQELAVLELTCELQLGVEKEQGPDAAGLRPCSGLTSSKILGKLLGFSESQFLHLQNLIDKNLTRKTTIELYSGAFRLYLYIRNSFL